MKIIWQVIKDYYLPTFIVLLIAFTLRLLIEGIKFSIEGLFVFLAIVFVLASFIGGIYHLHDKVIRPRREKRILENKNLNELVKYGFKKKSDSYEGYYKNYYLMITPVSTLNGESINIRIPIIAQKDNPDYIKKMSKKYNFTSNSGFYFFHQTLPIFVKIPTTMKIIAEADNFIEELTMNNIPPLKIIEN